MLFVLQIGATRCLRCRVASDNLIAMAKMALGKGLGALIAAQPAPAPPPVTLAPEDYSEKIWQVSLDSIAPSPLQPRKEFSTDALSELVESIRQHGIIQPLIVRAINGRYELIAGERRWRAAMVAGLEEVPVIIRSASDRDVLELSLIENLQRADLNPIEEAQGYARLAGEFGMRQEEIAQKVGRSRASVANAMRLLDLDAQVQTWLTQNLLSVGHAKVLLALKSPAEQLAVAETVLRRSATVRATERLVVRQLGQAKPRHRRRSVVSVNASALEHLQSRLQEYLGTRVILHHGEKQGRIEIEYYGADDLQRITQVIGLPSEN
jgi:ParB family transcriptional regulator, chromosome partitioning protein